MEAFKFSGAAWCSKEPLAGTIHGLRETGPFAGTKNKEGLFATSENCGIG